MSRVLTPQGCRRVGLFLQNDSTLSSVHDSSDYNGRYFSVHWRASTVSVPRQTVSFLPQPARPRASPPQAPLNSPDRPVLLPKTLVIGRSHKHRSPDSRSVNQAALAREQAHACTHARSRFEFTAFSCRPRSRHAGCRRRRLKKSPWATVRADIH